MSSFMNPSEAEIDDARRFWECARGALADSTPKIQKQKTCLQHLQLIASWVCDAKYAATLAKQLSNHPKHSSDMDVLGPKIGHLAEQIIKRKWSPPPSAPLRGNSTYSALVQFVATLLALKTLVHENMHMATADDVAKECARARDRAKHWAEVQRWCAEIRGWVMTCCDLVVRAFDSGNVDSAGECIALAGKFPHPPARKPLAQAAADARLRNATALAEDDDDGFGPVSTEPAGEPVDAPAAEELETPVGTMFSTDKPMTRHQFYLFKLALGNAWADEQYPMYKDYLKLFNERKYNPEFVDKEVFNPLHCELTMFMWDAELTIVREQEERERDGRPLLVGDPQLPNNLIEDRGPPQPGDVIGADADSDAGSVTGDEDDGRASPTYDMSGAENLVPAPAPCRRLHRAFCVPPGQEANHELTRPVYDARPPTPPEFYEGFAADDYSRQGADDPSSEVPAAAAPHAPGIDLFAHDEEEQARRREVYLDPPGSDPAYMTPDPAPTGTDGKLMPGQFFTWWHGDPLLFYPVVEDLRYPRRSNWCQNSTGSWTYSLGETTTQKALTSKYLDAADSYVQTRRRKAWVVDELDPERGHRPAQMNRKRKAESAAKDTGEFRPQKSAKAISQENRDAEHAALLDVRTALAHNLVEYGEQLHKIQCAGPRFLPNLGWASQEVLEIAKEIVQARTSAGSSADHGAAGPSDRRD